MQGIWRRLNGIVTAVIAWWQATPAGRFLAKWDADRGADLAVLFAYTLLFALFPVLLSLSAIFGLILRDDAVQTRVLNLLINAMPIAVAAEITPILDTTEQSAGPIGLIAIAGLIWSASAIFVSLETSLNRLWHVPSRPFLVQRVLALVFVPIGGILLLLAASLTGLATAAAQLSEEFVPDWLPFRGAGASLAGAAATFLVLFVLLLGLYWLVPNRRSRVREVWPGTLLAALLASFLFQVFPVYLAITGGFNRFGAAIGFTLLLFTYLHFFSQIVMIGGALNAYRGGATGTSEPAGADTADVARFEG